MEIIFAQLIVSPAATEQRQINVTLSLIAKQGSSNSRL